MYSFQYFAIFILIGFSIENAKTLETEKIVGGQSALSHDFKYQVSIMEDGVHTCGGSIIAEDRVITAAHCVLDEGAEPFNGLDLTVVAGASSTKDLGPPVIIMKVERIYIPSNHVFKQQYADVAVLKLAGKLNLKKNTFLGKVELPNDETYENWEAVVTGYGSVSLSNKRRASPLDRSDIVPSDKLRALKTRIISNTDCRLKYLLYKKAYPSLPLIKINDQFICVQSVASAAHPPSGSCAGDSGGPVVVSGNILVGVINIGPFNCDEQYAPGAHARVSAYRQFILSAMDDNVKCKVIYAFKSVDVCVIDNV